MFKKCPLSHKNYRIDAENMFPLIAVHSSNRTINICKQAFQCISVKEHNPKLKSQTHIFVEMNSFVLLLFVVIATIPHITGNPPEYDEEEVRRIQEFGKD